MRTIMNSFRTIEHVSYNLFGEFVKHLKNFEHEQGLTFLHPLQAALVVYLC